MFDTYFGNFLIVLKTLNQRFTNWEQIFGSMQIYDLVYY